jgi:hypothetical protein
MSATLGAVSGSTAITGPRRAARGAPANLTNVAGTNRQFTATGTYSDASTANPTGLATWSSSVSRTINAAGLAHGVTKGEHDHGEGRRKDRHDCPHRRGGSAHVDRDRLAILPNVAGTNRVHGHRHVLDASTATITTSVTWTSSNLAVATIGGLGSRRR